MSDDSIQNNYTLVKQNSVVLVEASDDFTEVMLAKSVESQEESPLKELAKIPTVDTKDLVVNQTDDILPGWKDVIDTNNFPGSLTATYATELKESAFTLNQSLFNWFQARFSTITTFSTWRRNYNPVYELEQDTDEEEGVMDNPVDTEKTLNRYIWLLGRVYRYNEAETNLPAIFRKDYTSRVWCTYRVGFPPILNTSFTNDIGWGCMMRTGQCLLAQAFCSQQLSRNWRLTKSVNSTHARIISWFNDCYEAPFSLHRIAELGLSEHGKKIGEWFGPHTISLVLKNLVSRFPECGLSVWSSPDGTLYRQDVLNLAKKQGNFSPLLVLIPTMLGVDQLNPVYFNSLKACFTLPSCVGVAGGRPSASLYFIGFQGDRLYYLDPHITHPAISMKPANEMVKEDLASYHCTDVRCIRISSIDPCMLLGFFFPDETSFERFCDQIKKLTELVTPTIFTIAEKAPTYGEDLDFGLVSDAEYDMS